MKKKKALEAFNKIGLNAFSKCNNFLDLYNLVEKATIPIGGFGDMTNYDISLNLGAFFKKYPEDVFLQCGSKKGAEIVLGESIKQRYLPISKFCEKGFPNMKPCELQMFLCVARKELLKLFAK